MSLLAASLRVEIGGYVSALALVYSTLIVAWVIGSWVMAAEIRPGRFAPVLHFLEAVVGPFIAIFRRFIPMLGPVDISPLVALLVVQFGGGLLASLIAG
ncbi:MAG: YggT family protein [Solirubrobacterales bacterium]|nr:YggT family protein [Solirubrobacterales bacterium]